MWNWLACKPCCFDPGGGKVLPAAEAQYLCTLSLAGPVACFHFGCAVCHVLSAFLLLWGLFPRAVGSYGLSTFASPYFLCFCLLKRKWSDRRTYIRKIRPKCFLRRPMGSFFLACRDLGCYFCFPLAACFFRNRGARWEAWIAILCRHTRVKAQERRRELESGVIYIANTWMCARVYVCVGYAFWCLNCCARFGERLLPSTVFGQLHGPRRRPLLGFRLRDLFLPSCSCCFFFSWWYALVLWRLCAAKAHWRYKPNHLMSNKVRTQNSNASLALFRSSCRSLQDRNKEQHAKKGNGVRT